MPNRLEVSWTELTRMALFFGWCGFILVCWPVAVGARGLARLLPYAPVKN
jgi:hypothetical protein